MASERSMRDDERRTTRSSSSRRSSGEVRRSSTRRSSSASSRSSARRPSDDTRRSSARRSSASSRDRDGSRRPAADSRRRQTTRRPASDARSSSARTPAARASAARKSARRRRQKQQQNRVAAVVTPVLRNIENFFKRLFSGQMSQPVTIGAAVAAVVLVLLIHHFLRLGVTVNGTRTTVWRGATVEKLLDKDIAHPNPGNLLAVDGSMLKEGGGDVCAATINGEKASIDTKLTRGAQVQIFDGEDVTEDYTTTEETIKAGTSDDSRDFDAYWSGSIHLLSDGTDGVRTTRTGKVSGKTVSEDTVPAIDAGYTIYTANPGDDKVICLTFDDGPWPETTSQILDILEQNGAKATFFTIGNQISEAPDQVKRANDLGCLVCTHTWDHAAGSGEGVNLTYMSSQEQIDEVQKGYNAIKEVTGEEPPKIMRAPGGNFFGSIIDTLWPYVDAEIGWDVDTEDWRQPGSDAIAEMILSVQPGQIILMHDGGGDRSQTVEALRVALPQLIEQGYKCITVEEMLAYGVPDASSSGVIEVG